MSRFPLRYLLWMVRDLLVAQGALLLGVAVLTAVITRRFDVPPPPAVVIGAVLTQLGWPFILFCTAGMVSHDRVQGYYRTLFARQVSPAGYYLQRWLLGAALVGLMIPLLTVALSVAIRSFPLDWRLMAQLELLYLLLGGLVFLASTLIRAEWLFALLTFIVESVLWGLKSDGIKLSFILNAIATILPPFHLVRLGGPNPTSGSLLHVLLYGTGLVLAALAVLRWRPVGVGGRS